jgi:dsRNA-specific ribonuclease
MFTKVLAAVGKTLGTMAQESVRRVRYHQLHRFFEPSPGQSREALSESTLRALLHALIAAVYLDSNRNMGEVAAAWAALAAD